MICGKKKQKMRSAVLSFFTYRNGFYGLTMYIDDIIFVYNVLLGHFSFKFTSHHAIITKYCRRIIIVLFIH